MRGSLCAGSPGPGTLHAAMDSQFLSDKLLEVGFQRAQLKKDMEAVCEVRTQNFGAIGRAFDLSAPVSKGSV